MGGCSLKTTLHEPYSEVIHFGWPVSLRNARSDRDIYTASPATASDCWTTPRTAASDFCHRPLWALSRSPTGADS
jgi:hypothetical protein